MVACGLNLRDSGCCPWRYTRWTEANHRFVAALGGIKCRKLATLFTGSQATGGGALGYRLPHAASIVFRRYMGVDPGVTEQRHIDQSHTGRAWAPTMRIRPGPPST